VKRSTTKILTTHVGSLPEMMPLERDSPGADARLREAVAAVVNRQRDLGIDIVNEGEYAKGGDWLSYVEGRFDGFEQRPPVGGKPIILQGRDREEFAEFYEYAATHGTLFYEPRQQVRTRRPHWACTRPITFKGQVAVQRSIDALRAATDKPEDAFITATAPSSLEPYYVNDFYKNEEEFVFAFAEAMRHEYEAIAKAGFLLQIDDAWLVALWDRIGITMGLEAFRKRSAMRVEALNHALANVAEAQIRYHLCWGSWHGPHAHDLELVHLVDILLRVKAQAYLIEAANARHEHEWAVWQEVKLPPGKILVPGVVTHSTDTIEHPELVSQRIQRFAKIVGAENVIAGTDCGFGGRNHPQIAWAKLKALTEGAALASRGLF
jgi:5-methyltetrahydropteroyltriglutamate--homocysteine methyltransferase